MVCQYSHLPRHHTKTTSGPGEALHTTPWCNADSGAELTSSEPGVSCCSDWDSRRGLELDTAPSVLSSKVTQPFPRTLVAVSVSPITAGI